ncbi:MAG: hypothetical protein HC906_17900 [Bacteroidales bacterium]|nr:hypothetical protein [Bacteroidales bacterium]
MEREDFSQEVFEFYRLNNFSPGWFNEDQPTADALNLLEIISHAEQEGLNSFDYKYPDIANRLLQYAFSSEEKSNRVITEIDLDLTSACLNYARHLHKGNVHSGNFYNKYELLENTGYYGRILYQNLHKNQFKHFFNELTPKILNIPG